MPYTCACSTTDNISRPPSAAVTSQNQRASSTPGWCGMGTLNQDVAAARKLGKLKSGYKVLDRRSTTTVFRIGRTVVQNRFRLVRFGSKRSIVIGFAKCPGQQMCLAASTRAICSVSSVGHETGSGLGKWDFLGSVEMFRDPIEFSDNAEVASSILASPTRTAHRVIACGAGDAGGGRSLPIWPGFVRSAAPSWRYASAACGCHR